MCGKSIKYLPAIHWIILKHIFTTLSLGIIHISLLVCTDKLLINQATKTNSNKW